MGVQRAGIPLHKKLEVLQWIDENGHIASHDVYGEQFYRAWEASSEPSLSREELELCEAVDDITIIDA